MSMANWHSIEEIEIYTAVGSGEQLGTCVSYLPKFGVKSTYFRIFLKISKLVSVLRLMGECNYHNRLHSLEVLLGLSKDNCNVLADKMIGQNKMNLVIFECSCGSEGRGARAGRRR